MVDPLVSRIGIDQEGTMFTRRWVIGYVLCFVLATSAQALAEKRPWKGSDAYRLKRIEDLQISPHDDLLVFTLSERSLEENRNISSIWTMSTRGGEPTALTDVKGSARSPRWSPDGAKIAFFQSDGEGLGLWTMNRDGSSKTKLTALEQSNAYLGLTGNELSWSPDGEEIAFTAAGPRVYPNDPSPQSPPTGNDVMVVDRLLYKSSYYYSDLRRTYVWIIAAGGGEPRQVSFGDYDYHSISWSPDGESIACISNRTGRDDYNANNDICLLSTRGQDLIQLTHTQGPEYVPATSPDGRSIACLGRLRDHRSKESDAELYKLYVLPTGGGRARDLTSPLDRWCRTFQWSKDGSKLYFIADDSGRQSLYEVPTGGGAIRALIDQDGQVKNFTLSGDGTAYYSYGDFTHYPEIYRWDPSRGETEKLTSLHGELNEEVEIIESEKFTFLSFDGLAIEGWILKPYGFEEGKKYPAILDVHGGPHWQFGYDLYYTDKLQLFAANGYVVVFMNPRGSTGRGQAFSDRCVGDLGGGDYRDLMAGLDHVLEAYDFIDPDRLGVSGISYGGYMANWMVTQTDRFKAAISVSGLSNLITAWGTGCNTLWFETDMGFMPFEDYERAWAASPMKYIRSCKTPVLFINGAWDFITNLNQAEEMFTALKKLGVDSVLAIYPNNGHSIHRHPAHRFDYYERSVRWFDEYLK